MSNTPMPARANVSGVVANIRAADRPIVAPNSARPAHHTVQKSASAAQALGRRSANSFSPKIDSAPAWSQWYITGLSMNGMPSSSGTIH